MTSLAEWSCSQVNSKVCTRGDSNHWVNYFDWFYLTRGHHSNYCSATLHDHSAGKISYFQHRIKRGVGHNWEVTTGGAEFSCASLIGDLLINPMWEVISRLE